MLYEFIKKHQATLVVRTESKASSRRAPLPTEDELNGVPIFLEQLVDALRRAGPASETSAAMGKSATLHGADMLRMGFTVAQVVRDYGDVCQAVTELADELDAPITVDEFQTLNRCLDDATAQAVTEYARLRERQFTEGETQRSGVLAHEMRNSLSAATMAFAILQSGRGAINGSVGAVVRRNMRRLGALVDRSLLEVRVDSGREHRQRVALRQILEENEFEGAMEADARKLTFSVAPIDAGLYVDVDPHVVAGAVANLLTNAFKFSREGGRVTLTTSATATGVSIDVQDECGGLPPGKTQALFEAFQQRGADRTGLGLGLFISRKGVEASGGAMRVRDVPGRGCVFTIELPRAAPPSLP